MIEPEGQRDTEMLEEAPLPALQMEEGPEPRSASGLQSQKRQGERLS